MQQLYNSLAAINSSYQSLKNVINVLKTELEIKQIHNVIPIPIRDEIEFRNLNFSYNNEKQILDNINLTIKKGEIIGIIGFTGGGKSTLIDILMGLLNPTSGEVRVDGNIVNRNGYSEKLINWQSSISHVPQNIYLIDASIAENIAFGEKSNNINMDKVKYVANKANISSFIESTKYKYKTKVGENGVLLSGGQRQRIGIARALSLSPKIIIADEAVSALDVSIQAQVVNLMMELQEEYGLSYLFISHDMAVIERVCHRVAVMYLGEIVELGSRSQVFENPQHPYTKKLMKAVPVADPNLRKRELNIMTDEIPSALKPINYEPEKVDLIKIEEGHFIKPYL